MTVGIGIVGAGSWARMIHIPTFRHIPGYRVVGATASNPAGNASLATALALPKAFADTKTLIEDPDVDVVDILVPNHLHKPVALAALEAGKDVMIIKPLATSVADAAEIVETAERRRRKVYYAENVPFIPALTALKTLADSGLYGTVFRFKSLHGTGGPHAAWFSDPLRSGGGAIMDMGVHGLAFLRWFANAARPVSIYVEAGTFVHPYPVEDTSVTIIRYDDGKLGQTEDCWSVPGGFDSRYEVFGTKGHAFADLLFGQPIRSILGGNLEGGSNAAHFHAVDAHIVKDGHVAMMAHFLDCITNGTPCLSTGEDGLAIMRLVEAAYRSLHTGSRVALS